MLPLRVSVPAPVFVKAPVPDITPLRKVEALEPPAVRLKLLKLIVPFPSIEPIVSVAPSW